MDDLSEEEKQELKQFILELKALEQCNDPR